MKRGKKRKEKKEGRNRQVLSHAEMTTKGGKKEEKPKKKGEGTGGHVRMRELYRSSLATPGWEKRDRRKGGGGGGPTGSSSSPSASVAVKGGKEKKWGKGGGKEKIRLCSSSDVVIPERRKKKERKKGVVSLLVDRELKRERGMEERVGIGSLYYCRGKEIKKGRRRGGEPFGGRGGLSGEEGESRGERKKKS